MRNFCDRLPTATACKQAPQETCLGTGAQHNGAVAENHFQPRLVFVLVLALTVFTACRTTPPAVPELEAATVADPLSVAPAAPLTVGPSSAPASTVASTTHRQYRGTDTWISLATFGRYLGFEDPVALATEQPASFALRRANTYLAITIGSRLAEYDGLICFLGFAPRLIKGRPYIHALDVRKNFEPLLGGTARKFSHSGTVVIDAGHGGRDPGTISSVGNHAEKEYTLDWARRLQTLLTQRGWRVTMTRTNDSDVALGDRVLLAQRVQAALFLSLHFNSGGANRDFAGIETYCLTPMGMPSHLVRSEADDPAATWPNNTFDEQNIQLASRVHRFLIETTGANDRGVRRARFMSVLRGQNRPAVLIEGGYLSNPSEARKIASAGYRQQLAEAIARGLE